MAKKILITGSNGLLGQQLVVHFSTSPDFKVVGCSRGENKVLSVNNFRYYNLDITNKKDLNEVLQTEKPEIIINCAAMTNVDQCEEEQKECDKINIDAVNELVNYCKKNKTKLIHLSTDFIFEGKKGYYKEDELPNPLNYYGKSKLKSEQLLIQSLSDFAIIRTILVYGTTQNTNRSNVVAWIKNSLESGKEIHVVSDQLRMPTLVTDLVKAIDLIIQKDAKGIFHISSNELLSIYEIAMLVAEEFNLDKTKISTITTRELNQKAKRPLKTGFLLAKAESELGFKTKSFREQIKEYKANLK